MSCFAFLTPDCGLKKDGWQIGYAEYHLIGKGALCRMKWERTKTTMDSVLEELLGNASKAVVGTVRTLKNYWALQRTNRQSAMGI